MRLAPAVPDRPGAPLGHYWKELPATGKDLEASTGARSSAFLRVAGLRLEESGGSRVRGWIDLGEDHHTPWGAVHGGVYTAAVESAASIGASATVEEKGQFAAGVNRNTDFLRPVNEGRVDVVAEPIMQGGKSQQLLQVIITFGVGKRKSEGRGATGEVGNRLFTS
jgi:1,4-dihydroxy-2-naphthoyl-CoA hydrolase